jgi:hypothetical protein
VSVEDETFIFFQCTLNLEKPILQETFTYIIIKSTCIVALEFYINWIHEGLLRKHTFYIIFLSL